MDSPVSSALIKNKLRDPFAYFGPHGCDEGVVIRTFQPNALAVHVRLNGSNAQLVELEKISSSGIFSGVISASQGTPLNYVLEILWDAGNGERHIQITEDPYAF